MGGCFHFHNSKVANWAEAMYQCDILGGFLAEPRTEEQANELKSIAFLEQTIIGVGNWWIGLTDQGHEGRWIWQHSDTHLNFSDWAPGYPSIGSNQADCAMMDFGDQFAWSDKDCIHSLAAPLCQKDQYASVPPYPTTTSIEDPKYHVELRGGPDHASGNVYAVNSAGYLGPVCDDYWYSNDANVVCRQLGYIRGSPTQESYFGPIETNYAMDDVRCSGNEYHLQDCTYTTYANCAGTEGAGVVCSNN